MPNAAHMARPPDSRDKILEVAEAAFAVAGYAGVGMRQLAAETGLSKSALFHHFPSKLDLYVDVLDRVLERIEAGLDLGPNGAVDPEARLERWIDAVVTTLSEDLPAARLLLRTLVEEGPLPVLRLSAEAIDAPLDRPLMSCEIRLARIIDRFRHLLEEGVETGAFRAVSIGDAILSVIGTVVFHFASGELGEAVIGESIFSGSAVERRRREVSTFIRRGLRA